jgi:hypothetical protein
LDLVIRAANLDDVEPLLRYATELFSEGLPGLCERPVPSRDDELGFIRTYCEPTKSGRAPS